MITPIITPSQSEPTPTVTVILPVYNEAQFIERCLTAILEQDYPAEKVTVLVIDGQSTDNTVALVKQLQQRRSQPHPAITVLNNPQRLQAYALNIGLAAATGEIVIRIDGHTFIATDYIRQCVITLQATGAQNVGGAMTPVGVTPMGKAIAAAGKSAFAVPSAFHVSSSAAYTDTVYLGAWPRAILEKLGGYNVAVGVNEDYELNYRIRAAGGKIYFTPAIRSEYIGRQTLQALSKQYFRYGISKVKTLRKHPNSVRPRQLVAPIFVAGVIVGAIAAVLSPILALLWGMGLLSYVVLNLAFSFRVGAHSTIQQVGRIALVFLVIHATWGGGFWVGLLYNTGAVKPRPYDGMIA